MTVERLHDSPCAECAEYQDAMRKIERLQNQLAIQYGMHPGGDLAKATQEEIKRLRAMVKRLTKNHAVEAETLVNACKQHLVEIERLQALIVKMLDAWPLCPELIHAEARRALEGK